MLAQPVGELADRRRLAGAVDPDDEHDRRVAGQLDARRLSEELGHLLRKRLVQIDEPAAQLEPPHQLGGGRDADVPRDQRLFEPLPRGGVAGIERRGGELLRERAAAAPERVTEPREEPRALLAALFIRFPVPEQLSPRACHGAEP